MATFEILDSIERTLCYIATCSITVNKSFLIMLPARSHPDNFIENVWHRSSTALHGSTDWIDLNDSKVAKSETSSHIYILFGTWLVTKTGSLQTLYFLQLASAEQHHAFCVKYPPPLYYWQYTQYLSCPVQWFPFASQKVIPSRLTLFGNRVP